MLTCNKDEIPIGPPASCFLFGVLCDPGEVVQSRALRVGKVGRAESKRAVNCVKIRGPHLLSSVYNNRTKEVSDQIKFITLVGIKKKEQDWLLTCYVMGNKANISREEPPPSNL